MTNSQEKQTNSQKILEYLQKNLGEISNEELAREIEIDKSNIPREIKKLEKQGYEISKRYEQIGRSKYVWFRLTNSQEKKQTNSHSKEPRKKVITLQNSKPKNHPKSIKDNRDLLEVISIEQMKKEVVIFGRTIPLDKVREIARKTLENSRNMIKGVKYYLNAWERRYNRYKEEKPDNFLIDEYENMQKTLTFLYEMKKVNEELKSSKKEN